MNPILYKLTIRNMIRSKKMWFAVALSLLPLLITLLMAFEARKRTYSPFLAESLFFVVGFTLIVTALILAGGLMSDEVEDRTISYLLTLPVRRWDLYMSRALAISVLVALLGLAQGLGAYFGELVYYWGSDMGASHDFANEIPASKHLGIGILFVIFVMPLIGVTYTLLASTMSLFVGKWHLIPVFALAILDAFGSLSMQFPLGPISAAYTLYEALLDTGMKAGHWGFSLVMLPLYLFLWGWLGAKLTERKDFHVTSAVT